MYKKKKSKNLEIFIYLKNFSNFIILLIMLTRFLYIFFMIIQRNIKIEIKRKDKSRDRKKG